jgi:hypothetical protein
MVSGWPIKPEPDYILIVKLIGVRMTEIESLSRWYWL